MLAKLVGAVDWNSAMVLCVLFIAVCIVLTAAIAKRRSRDDLNKQFQIDMQKLANEDKERERVSARKHEVELAKISIDRDVQFRRIESGLIEGKVVNESVRDAG